MDMNEAWKLAESLRDWATGTGFSLNIHTDSYVDLAPPVRVEILDRSGARVFYRETVYDDVAGAIGEGVRLARHNPSAPGGGKAPNSTTEGSR